MGQRRGFLGLEQIKEAGEKKRLEDEKKRKKKGCKSEKRFQKGSKSEKGFQKGSQRLGEKP